MLLKSKILLGFFLSFLTFYSIPNFAADPTGVTVQIINSTEHYYIRAIGKLTSGTMSSSFKDVLFPKKSGTVTLQPDPTTGLEGGFIVGVNDRWSISNSAEADFYFSDHSLLTQIIYRNLQNKISFNIQGVNSQWQPGQTIIVEVTETQGSGNSQ